VKILDNFNILKVLSSLISNKNTDNATQNQKNTSTFNTESINGLINAFKNFTQSQGATNTNQTKNPPSDDASLNKESVIEKPSSHTTAKPLQYSMLSTMASHDQFVERVMKKNKTT
jgi:hypothetical protein